MTNARHDGAGGFLPKRISRLAAAFTLGLLALAGTAASRTAQLESSTGIKLGAEEVLRPLQDTALRNTNNEQLFIGHKLTFHWFGLPWAVSDDGYVLGVKDKQIYYAVDKTRLARWQAEGHLPSALPAYRLKAADYALGYLGWLIVALVSVWCALRSAMHRPVSRPTETAAQAKAVPAAPAPAARQAGPVQAAIQPVAMQPRPQTASPSRAAASVAPLVTHRLPVAKTVCRVKTLKVA